MIALPKLSKLDHPVIDPKVSPMTPAVKPSEIAQLDGGDILAVHGTPTEDETFLLEDRVESRMHLSRPREMKAHLGDVKASLVLCGHSYTQQVVLIPGGPLIVNQGSVGCPVYADGPDAAGTNARSPHARYAIVTRNNACWSTEMFALAYDWERAARRALENNRPEWARMYSSESVLPIEEFL
jgi:hypothetical protein